MLKYFVDNFQITSYPVDSKGELCEKLQRQYDHHLILPEPEVFHDAFILSCQLVGAHEMFGIGVLSAAGWNVSVRAICAETCLAIGYDDHFAVVDLATKSILWDMKLGSPFFFVKQYQNILVIITELTIFFLTPSGQSIQSVASDDVILEFRFEKDALLYDTSSGTHRVFLSKMVKSNY